MTDIVKHQGSDLAAQIEWTRLVTAGDRAGSLLPDAYKGKPDNVLIAVGLGASMGLSPAESLYRIAVIKGKPTASAELIAANVRKAGHKLRIQSGEGTVTATIVRADDPDYPISVTRDMAWAQRMGLASNDNYKKQPETMLQWRAISAVARLACPEALYGVQYTPDEAQDFDGAPEAQTRRTVTSETFGAQPEAQDVTDAEEVTEGDPEGDPEPRLLTDHTRRKMFALLGEVAPDSTPEQQRKDMGLVLGREIKSRSELSEDDAQAVIDALQAEKRRREIAAETGGSGE